MRTPFDEYLKKILIKIIEAEKGPKLKFWKKAAQNRIEFLLKENKTKKRPV